MNDLTHFVGFVANLPVAVPIWIAAQVSDSVMVWVQENPSAFGTNDKSFGGLIGNSMKGEGRPGLLGTAISLVHKQGVWGDGGVFEAGQTLGHDNSIPGVSRWYISAPETALQFPGIVMKNFGFGPLRHLLPGANMEVLRGFHNGATPNRSTYSERGHNGR
ncbi:MAG: hypothetical protein IAE77_20480 [Prosthecobacter sp.]|nr:hypothetical protein [Prosthecobacter sp.]